jgi:diacylglycerol kinase family enzyme
LNGTVSNQKAFIITIANAGQWGNNAHIAPDADVADGYLNFCVVKKFPKMRGFGMGYQLFSKSIARSPYYSSMKIQSVGIGTNGDACYHLDGEIFPAGGNLEIGILPRALKVIVP